MSETQHLICLHCGQNANEKCQKIFDEVGVELELSKLLAEHFKIHIEKDDALEDQVLCEACVDNLVELYDLAEYAKQTGSKAETSIGKNGAIDAIANGDTEEIFGSEAILCEEASDNNECDETEESSIALVPLDMQDCNTAYSAEIATDSAINNNNDTNYGNSEVNCVLITETCSDYQSEAEQAKSDEGNSTVYVFENIDGVETYYESAGNSEDPSDTNSKLVELSEELHLELASDEFDGYENDEEINDTEDDIEEYIPDSEIQKSNEFDFVDIDLYLEQTLKSKLEEIQFNWQSRCELCSAAFSTFQEVLDHVALLHYEKSIGYICILPDCKDVLTDYRQLARHIILKHCDLKSLQIYGCCVECDMRFSNFIKFNKHSCCRTLKLRPGTRFHCLKCNLEFPSWKRYLFHMQFHMTKRRPKVCFLCESFFNDINEFFEHVHYAHEPDSVFACKKCDRIFKTMETYNVHEKSHQTTSKFHCQYCSRQYDHRRLLARHLETIHRTAELVACDSCDKVFTSRSSLMNHKKTHVISAEAQIYYCEACGLLDTDRDVLKEHVMDNSSNCYQSEIIEEILSNAYTCEYCNMDFRTPTDVKQHRDNGLHSNRIYICRICKHECKNMLQSRNHHKIHKAYEQWLKVYPLARHVVCDFDGCLETYTNWPSLYTHRKRSHNRRVCEVCHKQFKNDEDHARHQSKCQLEAEWTCQFCGKECKTKMSLSVHIARTHNNNNVTCSTCNASYKNEKKLQEHIDYMHVPVLCTYCNKTIKNQRNYETHERNVHLKEERYTCQHCNKGFYHKSERDAHVVNVHPSTEYACDECSFKTTYPKSLDIHIATTHKMEYQFKCHICSREFGRKHVLEMHIKRHELNKQLACPKGCALQFVSQHALNKHLREKHGIRKRERETTPKTTPKRGRRSATGGGEAQLTETSPLPEHSETMNAVEVENSANYIELTLLDEEDMDDDEQDEVGDEIIEMTAILDGESNDGSSEVKYNVEELDPELVEYIDC